jgi:hypothetical protein
MPYTNVPQHLQAKMDRCVTEVMKTGKVKAEAIAVCYTSVVEAPRKLLAALTRPSGPSDAVLIEASRYTPKQEAVATVLQQRHVLEAGARHTQREYQIIEQVIQLMVELHGELDDVNALVAQVHEAIGVPTIIDFLISRIHREFTVEADAMLGELARITQDERIFLSHAIGVALDTFNTCIDLERPDLRLRTLYKVSEPYEPTPPVTVNVNTTEPPEIILPVGMLSADDLSQAAASRSEPEDAFELMAANRAASSAQHSVQEASRDLIESVLGQVGLDANGNLGGIVVVEGRSDNGNVYTEEALQTVPAIFAGAHMFVNHPTMTEEMERPEGDLYDLVGRLPQAEADFYIDTVREGKYAGRKACFFRNGFLSETADWLKTKIREGLAGDMSIRAQGRGYEEGGDFVVEAFTVARSLDFVTRAAAGGRAQLLESARITVAPLTTLTLEQLSEARPDWAAAISTHVQTSAREKHLQEANRMAELKLTEAQKKIVRLSAALRQAKRDARKTEADRIVGEALAGSALPVEAQTRVRLLAEASIKRFVEADPQAEPPGTLAPTGSALSAGDPATIELPPDVAELPTDPQGIWLETYVAELPKGEARAVNLAWASVYAAGWVKGDQGWYSEQATQPAVPAEPMPLTASATTEALRSALAKAVASEKAYLAKVTEAGRVTGMGGGAGGAGAIEDNADEKLVEAYQGWGLTDKQARVAVQGRG